MSIKTMVTKLALAFAAKKGMEALKGAGGIEGLRANLGRQGNASSQDDADHQVSAGHAAQAGQTNPLGQILDAFGLGGSTQSAHAGSQGSPMNGSLGAIFGSLASTLGGRQDGQAASKDLDSQFETNDIQTDDEAKAIMRAMVHMARSDGAVDAQEQAALLDILSDASPDERAVLQEALREPVDAKSIAAETPPRARKEVYAAALLLGEPNAPQERKFLAELADALDLRPSEVSDLHRAIGKPEATA